MSKPTYKRIILKISGEILGNRDAGEPIFAESLEKFVKKSKPFQIWVEVGLVVGGGNIFRGLQEQIKESIELRVIPWACLPP